LRHDLDPDRPRCCSPPRGMAAAASGSLGPVGGLDLRRQAAIAKGGLTDHRLEAVVLKNPDFDLDQTIFKTLEGFIPRLVMKKDLAVKPFWHDVAVQRITAAYSRIERPHAIDADLHEFMLNECNFSMEHADGSFMDHLVFCRDYCQVHFKPHSPRVLLIHSILGVGTNYFPMEAAKIPQLAALLTPHEMKHTEAFPSILRLILSWKLLDELAGKLGSLDKLKSIKFHRVIDNQDLELDAEEFWVQMNYQMIHLLDFAPTADWESGAPVVFQCCLGVYDFLTKAGQLRATVAIQPVRMAGLMPTLKRRIGVRVLAKYSAQIGHSLDYELRWDDSSRL